MNNFTQAVDPALWFSRAFDDAEYDSSPAEPLVLPRIDIAPEKTVPQTLVILTSPAALTLQRSHFAHPAPAIGSVSGHALQMCGHGAVLAVPTGAVSDAHASEWMRSVVDALRPRRIVILTTMPAFRLGRVADDACSGDDSEKSALDHGVGAVGDQPISVLGKQAQCFHFPSLQPPAMLDGIAAAALCEAEYRPQVEGCAYIAHVRGVDFDGECLALLSMVLDGELGVAAGRQEQMERTKRHALEVRRASIASNSHSLYM